VKEIALVSHSKDPAITTAILTMIASAITRQLCEDYANVWQSQGVQCVAYDNEKRAPIDAVLMVIFDKSTEPGALGYHDVSPGGRAFSRIFWKPIRESGGTLVTGDNSLSVTISHEALELREDYGCNAWHDMQDAAGTEDARELCDRVEGDSYPIDGVSVSNFLGPRAFRKGTGPYDFLGMQGDPRGLTWPFEIRPNGYAIRRVGGPAGDVQSIFGASYPQHKKEMKLADTSKASKRGVRTQD
jgi:hypothetical protein